MASGETIRRPEVEELTLYIEYIDEKQPKAKRTRKLLVLHILPLFPLPMMVAFPMSF